MAKGGKAAPWKGVARGVLAALALYLCGTALLALLMVKGAVPERAGFPVLMVLCVASALCGGRRAVPALPLPHEGFPLNVGFSEGERELSAL